MNIHDIEAFVAVVESGSITAAASRLHITQPAISRRIKNLEDRLGVVLLERLSKPLKPTMAGKDAYERGRAVLGSVADMFAGADPEAPLRGEFRVGVAPFLAELTMTQPLDALRGAFDALTLRVTTGWSTSLLTMLEMRAIDTAVVVLAADVSPPSGQVAHLIACQRPLLVASRTSLLSAAGTLALDDLSTQSWVLNQDGCGIRRALQNALDAACLRFDVAIDTFSSELQLSLVARGMGVGMIMPGALTASAYRNALQVLNVPEFTTLLNIWLVHARTPGRLAEPIKLLQRELAVALKK